MPSQKLTHAAFWDRMDRATRHVGKLPDWVKGTPSNERPASSVCDQCQTSAARSGSGSNSTTTAVREPLPPRG
jgi:hypothetical protein